MEPIDLEKMTAPELKEYALKNHPDITGVHAMKKEDLVLAIRKARGEEVKETPKKKKTPGKAAALDKKQLKQKIRALRTVKDQALQEKDKTKLARLRKRIKRFKRLTKRAA